MRTIKNKISGNDFCEIDRLFLSKEEITALVEKFGTPLFLYDEKGLRQTAQSLLSAFSVLPGMKPVFPVGLCPREELMTVLMEEGFSAYCRTPDELQKALACGFSGSRIVYATTILHEDFAQLLRELDVHLLIACPLALTETLPKRVDLACRISKARSYSLSGGGTRGAHIGFTREEVQETLPKLHARGAESIGLAMMRGGNVTDEEFLGEKIVSLLKFKEEAERTTGVSIQRIFPGEGPGFRYKRTLGAVDVSLSAEMAARAAEKSGVEIPVLFGHSLLEPCGTLLLTVLGILHRDSPTVMVDGNASLLTTRQLDRYRHTSIVGKERISGRIVYDVAGCTADPGDWFTEKRVLQPAEVGDCVAVHDVGCSLTPGADVCCLLCGEDGEIIRL